MSAAASASSSSADHQPALSSSSNALDVASADAPMLPALTEQVIAAVSSSSSSSSSASVDSSAAPSLTIDSAFTDRIDMLTRFAESGRVGLQQKRDSGLTSMQIRVRHRETCRLQQSVIRALFLDTELRDMRANHLDGEAREMARARQKKRSTAMFLQYGLNVVACPEVAQLYVGASANREDHWTVKEEIGLMKKDDPSNAQQHQQVRSIYQGRTGDVDVRRSLMYLNTPEAHCVLDRFESAAFDVDELISLTRMDFDREKEVFQSLRGILAPYKSAADVATSKLMSDHFALFDRRLHKMSVAVGQALNMSFLNSKLHPDATAEDRHIKFADASVQIQKAISVHDLEKHSEPVWVERPKKRARTESEPSDASSSAALPEAAAAASSSSSSSAMHMIIDDPM